MSETDKRDEPIPKPSNFEPAPEPKIEPVVEPPFIPIPDPEPKKDPVVEEPVELLVSSKDVAAVDSGDVVKPKPGEKPARAQRLITVKCVCPNCKATSALLFNEESIKALKRGLLSSRPVRMSLPTKTSLAVNSAPQKPIVETPIQKHIRALKEKLPKGPK
jgi:hypothetical protein